MRKTLGGCMMGTPWNLPMLFAPSAALWRGRIDYEALRKLLAHHPLAGTEGEPFVYAVDTSVWPRCDAEASPERGYYYHPSRHSAGQPIVAGWSYQFVAQLGFVRESWTAPMDVRRVRPAQDANAVAAEQVRSFLRRSLPSRRTDVAPLFVFDAGYDPVIGAAGTGGEHVPDPRPLARRAPLLRRPEPVRPARTHRTPSSPRAEDEVLRCCHLARALSRASLRGGRLRLRARAGVG